MAGGLTAAWTLIGRAVRLSRRNPEALLLSLMLPVMMMLIFVYLFGGAINTGTSYVTYVVPGVTIVCFSFGAGTTAVTVCQDLTGGIVDRFRAMNLGGASIVIGQVVASVLRNVVAGVMVFAVAFAIGFRPRADAGQWLGAAGLLLLTILAFSSLAAAIGLLAATPDAANGFSFIVTFLPYASSAFVPIATMPTWLRGFANNQPATPIIETLRGLLLDHPLGAAGWHAVVWCVAVVVVSLLASVVLFRRRTT